jgi:DNA invertase Pin-like site-specific DNA recombinase
MSTSNGNGKALRFAALIRVSTEKQADRGESLRTQDKQITSTVETLGGQVAVRYAGQEHGTPDWERKQLTKLLEDAAKPSRPFDAVIVADATRWSRDNVQSKEGLKVLRDARVRFFVLGSEYDLFNDEHRLFLGLTAEIGEYHAASQRKKSLINRIERARRGIPTAGKVPFGRKFNAKTETWSIDPAKQALIAEVAERYLRGERLRDLATEKGMNHSNLCKTFRYGCGTEWGLEFHAEDLAIHETVSFTVPRLLDEKVVKAVQRKLLAKRTRENGHPKTEYLLRGKIFCLGCGYLLTPQWNPGGRIYYRHPMMEQKRHCPYKPKPWVRSARIEEKVIQMLFNMFGNPTAIERAVKAAIPDCDQAVRRQQSLQEDLAKIGKARDRVLGMIEKDLLTDDQAEKKLQELKDREGILQEELTKLADTLADVPTQEVLQCYVEKCQRSIFVLDDNGNEYLGGNELQTWLAMTEEEKRALVCAVFDAPLADGTPSGVYIYPLTSGPDGRPVWGFKMRGRLEFEAVMENTRKQRTRSKKGAVDVRARR